jgi:ABC-type transport system involved in multi-copper enzyme maturation permease subunit
MNAQLRAEFLKQRTTRTTIGMVAAMLGFILLAIALHGFGLPAKNLRNGSDQLGIFIDVGENLGSLFAALFGAMAITTEVRHGTIRPTLLSTPQRGHVVAAKTVSSLATGVAFGAIATAVAAGAGTLFLAIRGITVNVGTGGYAQLIAGGAAAAALWAVIGLGVGCVARSQVPAVVGIFVWVLFVENILFGSVPSVGKFAPATLGRAIAGATNGTLHTPAIAVVLLVLYAGAAITAGWFATTRRDFA